MRAGTTEAGRRLLWFVGLWLAGVLAVGSVAYLLRLVMKAV
ncbi:DUF2474 family protein [Muricoccus radiodurans]